MEQEVGPACSTCWTVGQGGKLSVCLSSSYTRLALERCLSVPCTPSLCGAVSIQYISNNRSREVLWHGSGHWSCPVDVCGFWVYRKGAWSLLPAALLALVPGCSPAWHFWQELAPRQELSPSRLWGERMCKALGLFEGPTDPPQRWPIHSRLPGNNNQEK